MQQGADYYLLIAATAALILIFVIMAVLTRAAVAAAVIVGAVVLSLAASFGLSVLLWQHLVGIPLHWMVLPTGPTCSLRRPRTIVGSRQSVKVSSRACRPSETKASR